MNKPRPALLSAALLAAALLSATHPALAQPVTPPPPDPFLLRCLLPTHIPDNLARCLPTANPSYHVYLLLLTVLAHDTSELMTRYDTPDLTMATPRLTAALEGPFGRWGVHVSMLADVDVVTNASADLVSTASTSREVRYAPALGGHKKLGDVDVNLHASASRRPNRLDLSMGGGVSVDLRHRTIIPSLDYTFSNEALGAASSSPSLLSRTITRHTLAADTAFALDAATLFIPTLTVVIENGDTSSLTRHIPLFSSVDAAGLPAGATAQLVSSLALPPSPFEQLPTSRQRVALAALFAHRFSSATLRLEKRLSVDNWGLKASTTGAQVLVDAGARVRVWPEVRAHVQTGADFWRLAYVATAGPGGWTVPPLRTGQLDLGPLLSVTGGAGTRVALDEQKRFALTVNGDVSYTRFLDHLYVVDRAGYAGAVALEADVP